MSQADWKVRAAEIYHLSIAEAEGLRNANDPKKAPLAFIKIGIARGVQDLLLEYGVDVEQKPEESKIVLLQ